MSSGRQATADWCLRSTEECITHDCDQTDHPESRAKRGVVKPSAIPKGLVKSRRFRLRREKDISGVSGTGYVAEGVEFVCGMVALSWYGSHQGVNVYHSMRTCVELHGHDGATKVEWVDV